MSRDPCRESVTEAYTTLSLRPIRVTGALPHCKWNPQVAGGVLSGVITLDHDAPRACRAAVKLPHYMVVTTATLLDCQKAIEASLILVMRNPPYAPLGPNAPLGASREAS